ncbi:unnamed protein product [Peronospora belbahrii]|uniref:Uncharacterized protein n=1 Tax=Peronospora belbahrii TaxID=622444 RepID=A0AAU9KTP0_9STRA|nr:unnamed protein product [Peronospora belbahrii]
MTSCVAEHQLLERRHHCRRCRRHPTSFASSPFAFPRWSRCQAVMLSVGRAHEAQTPVIIWREFIWRLTATAMTLGPANECLQKVSPHYRKTSGGDAGLLFDVKDAGIMKTTLKARSR